MSCAHRRRAEASLIMLAALFLFAATLVVGCGGQSGTYEGTWIQKSLPNSSPATPLTIKKVGDKYAFTGPDGQPYSSVIHTTPTGGQFNIYGMILSAGTMATQDGGKLKLLNGKDAIEITVSGNTMTMAVPSVKGAFTFSRVTAK